MSTVPIDSGANTNDRALEAKDLNIVITVPFLVGYKEDLDSAAWGFNNSQYRDLIEKSKMTLMDLISKYYEVSGYSLDAPHKRHESDER